MDDFQRCGNEPKFPGGPPQGGLTSVARVSFTLTVLPALARAVQSAPIPDAGQALGGFAG